MTATDDFLTVLRRLAKSGGPKDDVVIRNHARGLLIRLTTEDVTELPETE